MSKLSRNHWGMKLAMSWILSACCGLTSQSMGQINVPKADNSDNLDSTTSWLGGVVPGVLDTAVWDATVTGANTVSLGSNLSWRGIRLTSPGGAVTIGAGNTLTLGSGGIDMSSSTQDLTISSGLTIGSGAQTWNVTSGRTLTLNTGTFTRSAGATLSLSGAGTVTSTMTGLTAASQTSSILPWATVGTGAATRFATFSGNNLVGYTAGTAAAANAAWGGIPSGGTGVINYDISLSGTPGQTGLGRNVNSIRYTGTGLVQQGNNAGILLNTNAILNAGTGTFSLATGGGSIFGITAGSTNELVLNAANAGITVNAYIANNGANAGRVTVTGPQTVVFSGTNTFTGDLTVNGTLTAGTGQGTTPTASNLGALQPAANRNIIVNSGGILSLTGGNVLGTGSSTNTLSNTTLVVNEGGLFRTGLDGAGTGWWNKIGATNLSGGTIRVGSGANTGVFQGLALIGNVNVLGNTASTIENFAASNAASNGVHLGQNAAVNQSITFNVADVSGNSNADLNVSTRLLNTSANLTASGLTKTGAGTMTLSAVNAYTGTTVISAGTLQIGNGVTDGSIATSGGITNNANLGFNLLGTHTYANAITGTGNLIKTGIGSVTFSGANNYTGSTTLDGGTLRLRGTIGAVSVGDASSNLFGNATPETLSLSSLSFAGDATLDLSLNAAPALAVSGALTTTPANGTVTLNAGNTLWVTGNNSIITYGSGGGLTGFTLGTINGLTGRQVSNGLVDTGSAIALNVAGDLPVWTGENGNDWTTATTGDNTGPNNWATKTGTTATNFWAADTPEFNDSYFIGPTEFTVNNRNVNINGANVSPGLVAFNHSNGDYTLSSSTANGIVGAASLLKSGTSALSITNANTYSGLTTINAGTVNLSGGLSGTAITVANGASLNVSSTGLIAGASSLNANGSVVLASANTYTGTTVIGMGGSLQLGDGTTDGSITSSTITNNGALVYNTLGTQSFAHAITGTGTIAKNGIGTLTLSSAVAGSSGGTSVNAGKLVANTGLLNVGGISIASGATLTLTGNNSTSISTITGSGAILNDTANTIIFTGNHSGFNGTFTHNAAVNNSQFNTASSTSANAAYAINAGEMIFTGAGDYTVQMGSLASTAGVIRGGNSVTGIATLEVGNLNTNTSIAGNLNSGATKVIALTKVGTGTLSLNGVNSYSGATNVNAGTLAIVGSKTGIGPVTVASAATLNLGTNLADGTAAGAVTVNGTVSGRGTLSGAVAIANNAVVANGNGGTGTINFGSLTFSGVATTNLTLGAGPGINVAGVLTSTPANGLVTINASKAGWLVGNNNLIGFGSFAGSLSDFMLGTISGFSARQTPGALTLSGNNIALTVFGDPTTWTGANGSVWTTATDGDNSGANNWATLTGQTGTNFWTSDSAEFNDTYNLGAGPVQVSNRNVSIQGGNVAPGLVTFNNSAGDYSLASSDGSGIAGLSSLVKSGSSSLIVNNANTYSGGTTLNAGTLDLRNASAIGTGNLTINGGTLDNGSGSAITLSTNNTQTWNSDISFAGSSSLNMGNGVVTLSGGTRTVSLSNGATLGVGRISSTAGGMNLNGSGTLAVTTIAASAISGELNVGANATLQINTGATVPVTGDFVASLLTGSGTIVNGGGVERWMIVDGTTDSTFAGQLQNGATGPLGLSKRGTGTLTISGNNNSMTGAVTISTGGTLVVSGTLANASSYVIGAAAGAGVLRVDSATPNALGSGAITFDITGNASTARLELANSSLSNPITLAGRTNSSVAIQNLSGNSALTGTISIAAGGATYNIQSDSGMLDLGNISAVTGARTVTFGGAGNGNVAGNVSNGGGTVGIAKTGAGEWALSGANIYTGATTVNAGTLLVNGSTATDSTVTVNTGGTLGGSGLVGGIVNVNAGATLAPGNSIESLGSGTLNFATNSIFAYEADTIALNGDLLFSTGSLNIANGSVLTLSELASGTVASNSKLTLISYTGTWNGGFFTYQGNPLADDTIFALGSNSWLVNYNDTVGGSNFVANQAGATGFLTMTATAIPEPSIVVLGSVTAIGWAYRRRRQRVKQKTVSA